MRVVYATLTAPCQTQNGVRAMVQKGSHWPADDPIVLEHPDWFSADPRFGLIYSVEPDGWDAPLIESASAVPGERRSVRRTNG